jgi:histone-lysine N-methyltransferase SETMAR
MDEREQRVVIKFLWLQKQGSKVIHADLRGTLGDLAVSLPSVKRWLRRFREGNTSCEDGNRAGRPLTILRYVLSKFLSKCLFASAKNIASHFDISVSTVKDLRAGELGLHQFTRRRVPHSLSERSKNERVIQSRLLLDLLQSHQTASFNAIAIEAESWFRYVYPARTMYARSRSDVTSCVRSGISTSKVMITIFTGTRLLVLKALPKSRKLNQDYFLEKVLPSLSRQNRSNRRKELELDFVVHMDNSMCHNARKICLELAYNKIERAPHPVYSPDIRPCDFWLFGFLNEKLKEQKLSTSDELIEAVTTI